METDQKSYANFKKQNELNRTGMSEISISKNFLAGEHADLFHLN